MTARRDRRAGPVQPGHRSDLHRLWAVAMSPAAQAASDRNERISLDTIRMLVERGVLPGPTRRQ